MEKQEESCPSFPGLKLLITRPEAVAVRYNALDGTEITEKLEGAAARAWLHEYDHTQGICFTDRASRLHRNMAKKRLTKILKRSQA
jgi:peptide deformylase